MLNCNEEIHILNISSISHQPSNISLQEISGYSTDEEEKQNKRLTEVHNVLTLVDQLINYSSIPIPKLLGVQQYESSFSIYTLHHTLSLH